MGLDLPLAAAFIDGGARQKCLGVTMRRFSLWHIFLLRACDSPLVNRGNVNLFHLQNAVAICRLGFPDSRIVRPWLRPSTLYRLCRKGGLAREVLRFISYTGDYISKPEYGIHAPERPNDPPKPRGPCPPLMALVADIVGWAHWPEERVWNLPVGRAHWYQAMAMRAGGADVDFQTEHEREFEAAMIRAGHKPTGTPPL